MNNIFKHINTLEKYELMKIMENHPKKNILRYIKNNAKHSAAKHEAQYLLDKLYG